ncbi:lysophospholipid acyltransferase family protein [Verrucomicrobiota bacterium sgz303538]
MTRWKAFRYYLEELGCRLLASAIPRLSRRSCVRLAKALGTVAYLADTRGRAVALSNLECVFGERFSPAEREALARASYQNFLRTMLDLFWSTRLTPQNFREYLYLEGFDELKQRLAGRKEGAVFFCVHQGNWEWASLAFGFLGLQTSIVAENFKNPSLTTVFSAQREVSGHKIIPQESSVVRLLKVVKRGGWAGLLIDLSLRPSQAATILEAFKGEGDASGGLEMCVPLLHAVLARRAGAMLIPVETEPLPDGTCRVRALPPVEWPEGASLQEIAQRCWDPFEPILRARPAEWLWPYKHFRYKPAAARRTYPTYAHKSSKFEKLRRDVFGASSGKPLQ